MKANAKSIVRAKSLFLIIKDTAVSKISIIRLCVTGPRLTTECHKTKGSIFQVWGQSQQKKLNLANHNSQPALITGKFRVTDNRPFSIY